MNKLGLETSPYLLQHKDNPVHWQAWGEAAFALARSANMPIFLSIGYSTCYWCHVMAHESFENEAVAKLLNEHFVSIKVDREERPDVDRIYMDAVIGITGHGGWPMSVFLTPDLKPFWGGTYFQRPQFLQILQGLADAWHQTPDEVKASGEALTEFLRRERDSTAGAGLGVSVFTKAISEYAESFDERQGGFGGAPKFPPSQQISFLLREYARAKNESGLNMAKITLDRMARGGIFDQLGGGFHRYATDARWLVPHFEKMLYDNALLATTYAEAFKLTKKPQYQDVVEATLGYLLRDMRSPEGAFYSAEDAGEVGKEGEFYVWGWAELQKLLSEGEFKKLSKLYGVSESGNFEHGANILHLGVETPWSEVQSPEIKAIRNKLFEVRASRARPERDDKILVSWNGLAITALATAYQAFGNDEYLASAQRAAAWILDRMHTSEGLRRCYAGGKVSVDACLDDYAYLIEALLNLYASDFDVKWFVAAEKLCDELDSWSFKDGYRYSKAPELIADRPDIIDNATPSGNAVMLQNLFRLYGLTGKAIYRERAQAVINLALPILEKYPGALPKTLQALYFDLVGTREIAVVADRSEAGRVRSSLHRPFFFDLVFAVAFASARGSQEPLLLRDRAPKDGPLTIYLCRNQTCQEPVNDFSFIQNIG